MDHDIKNRTILLLLDGCRLLSMGILQQQHRDIDELLSDGNIHTKVRKLRDSGRISDEHFHLLFPPTDLSQWDTTITSHFLKHCIDLEEPQRTIMDELHELRNKGMEMYQHQGMSDEECISVWKKIVYILEKGKTLFIGPIVRVIDKTINRMKETPVTPEDMDRVKNWYDLETKNEDSEVSNQKCTSEWETIVRFLERGKTLLTDPIDGEIDEVINRIKQAPVTPEGMDRVNSWYDLSTYEDTETVYEVATEGRSVVHDAALHGKMSTLEYMRKEFPDRLLERDKDGNQAVHFAAGGGHIGCLRYIFESFPVLNMATNKVEMDALHCAARGGSLDCITYLISQGMNTDTRTKKGDTLLHLAAYGGSLSMVQYIYESFPDLQMTRNENEMNALHCAARDGSLDCLTYLISQGMNTDTQTKYGDTLLHLAARRGSLSMVQYVYETCPGLKKEINEKGQDALYRAARGGNLVSFKYLIYQGMNSNTRSKYGSTLLHAAAYGGIVSMVQYILETFPNMKNETDTKGMDALFSATRGESLDCLIYLIGKGMTMDTRSKYGSTILHEAGFRGSLSMVQYICRTFPYLKNVKTLNGMDALCIAVQGTSIECVKYLIDQGLNTYTRSTDGHTLLHSAAYGGSVPMVQYIFEIFPDLKNEGSQKGIDALFSAVRGGSLDCVKYLIGQGMTIYSGNTYGNTILHQAAFDGHEGVVRYLCENYSQLLSYKQTHGQTAIFSATNGGHLDILKYLLSKIDPKQTDKKGQTVLHAAAWKGKTDIVRYLCATFKFLIYMKGFEGETAIELARRNGHLECVKIIQERL